MAKQKPETKTEEKTEEKSIRDVVKDIVKNIGDEANYDKVAEELKRRKTDFSESTVKQYVSAARVELGFSSPRGSGGGGKKAKTTSNDEPTLTDLRAAEKLCAELKMKPEEMLTLVNRLNEIGSTEKLAKCLEYLAE